MRTPAGFLEILEPRIAPAVVVLANGGNLLSAGDQGYLADADSGDDATLLVKVTGGKALVFWDSDAKEIKGISVSNGANLQILGDVKGDIVTNLTAEGFLTDSNNNPLDGLDGGRLLASSIAGIKTNAYFDGLGNAQNGNIGRIIAGGSISNVSINGDLEGVYSGDGIFDAVATAGSATPVNGNPTTQFVISLGDNFDSSGPGNLSTMTLKMSDAAFAPTASISGVTFASGINVQFFAGDGISGLKGTPANGGSISNLKFVGAIVDFSATDFFAGKSYSVSAGDGGNISNGDGGIGGSITGITETGSGGNVYIHGGNGGNGDTNVAKGGVGGSVSNLDLKGGIINYDIQSGNGGNGSIGGSAGSVATSSISNSPPISLSGPLFGNIGSGDIHRDTVVINVSSGEFALLDYENKLVFSENAIASAPVDALLADLNNDSYLDIVVVYGDGSLGILSNDPGNPGNFFASVKDLGFKPFRVLAGNFLGDGGNQELAIITTDSLFTTVRLYAATDATDANSFVSDPNLFLPYSIKKGNLADAAGGTANGNSMELIPDPTALRNHRSDLVLGFADGTLMGLFSSKGGKFDSQDAPLAAPFKFTTSLEMPNPFSNPKPTTITAPIGTVAGGISKLEYNFSDVPVTYEKAGDLLAVNANGSAVHAVTITTPEPPPEPPANPDEPNPPPAPKPVTDRFTFNVNAALELPSGAGTILQASWLNTSAAGPSVMLLTSTSQESSLLTYENSGSENSRNLEFAPKYYTGTDFLLSSFSNNALYVDEANWFYFSSGYNTLGVAFDQEVPVPRALDAIQLPFAATTLNVLTGFGGTGVKGAGGNGGDIRSLNFDANFAYITTGNGGTSSLGAGGHGGSVTNNVSFRLSSKLINPTMGVTNLLNLTTGQGADVSGSSITSRAGNGGSITGVTFSTTGYIDAGKLVKGSLVFETGSGGNSESLAAGNGGSVNSTTILNAKDVNILAGQGGNGAIGLKATGGNGGSIINLVGGNTDIRFITGSVSAIAGVGGTSANARAGNGGSVATVNLQNLQGATASLGLTAGAGGESFGADISANGGNGGAISGVRFVSDGGAAPMFTAGAGGNAIGGSGGAGGGLLNLNYTGGPLSLTAGQGGNSTGILSKGTGGAGGSISGLTATITGSGYMTLEAGQGGSGVGAAGGTGGAITNSTLKLDPSKRGALDETLGVSILSGQGGNGFKGGAGGLISGVSATGVYNNSTNDGFVTLIDSIAMRFVAGSGGAGLMADGGIGGSIVFSKALLGLSQIDSNSVNPDFLPTDEALRVSAGHGGDGATKGGLGGSVTGLKVANVRSSNGDLIPINLLSGAFVQSGNGGNAVSGDGGAGGNVASTVLTVERQGNDPTGNLRVLAGDGGNSTSAKGGAGGQILNATLGSTNGSNSEGYALLLQTGDGGSGGKFGGIGGNMSNVSISVPSVGINQTNSNIYGAVLIAGDGGDGTGISKATGGVGGSIVGLNQIKDAFSVINLIQAGSGGNSSADTKGGLGGSVSNVKAAGYLGAVVARANAGDPAVNQGQFNTIATSAIIDALTSLPNLQQGVFAGLGGTGLTRGLNGSVTGVNAPYISAIGAANLSGTFEKAATVSKIAALLVAYDLNGDGNYDAGDGFVMADKFLATNLGDLKSLVPSIVSNASLATRTAAFVNP